MATTSLRRVGGSVMLAVPPAILKQLNLESGATVGLTVDGDRLVIEARPRPRYTLEELLAQCNAAEISSDENREWLDLKPLGREL
jgi:antitoxin ChpS